MRFTSSVSLFALSGLFLQVTARLSVLGHGEKGKIPNSYIVVFYPSVNDTQIQEHTHHISTYHARRDLQKRGATAGIRDHFNLEHNGPGFKGYTVECDSQTLNQILSSPDVKYVEQEGTVTKQVTQKSSTWNLARISWKSLPSAWSYRYQATWAGKGTTIYVVDTGVRTTHKEFENRATWGYNAIAGTPNSDQNGHGTHVAGIAAGKTYGVAKLARIVAVKVLDLNANGKVSYTLAGLNYVSKVAKPGKSVVNMSLGGARSQSLNDAVEALYKKGIIVVVAAGNDGDVASAYSPASAKDAITVGATDYTDTMAYFSNYGFYIDLLAPGVSVISSWSTSDTASKYEDGTSMASPHVAGLAAYLLSSTTAIQSPLTIYNKLVSLSLKNIVDFVPSGTANRLAYNGFA
ncbi:subtilisin-like serine protease [Orbilia ellipsospora]|uniref:Subtilisin-like serine protease n=1 Tax=Orbilia ellipsospora TaxID=2528407 RepID=A0AAV9WXZ7_9PEZI